MQQKNHLEEARYVNAQVNVLNALVFARFAHFCVLWCLLCTVCSKLQCILYLLLAC